MGRHRLTETKMEFARMYLATCEGHDLRSGNVSQAARAVGTSDRNGRKYMERDDDGELIDRSIASYFEELMEGGEVITLHPRPSTSSAPASVAEFVQSGDHPFEVDKNGIITAQGCFQALTAMAADPHAPDGAKLRAVELMMKALGADKPEEGERRDDEKAIETMRRLLGVS